MNTTACNRGNLEKSRTIRETSSKGFDVAVRRRRRRKSERMAIRSENATRAGLVSNDRAQCAAFSVK
jgi:hypothetical protein